ncbi:hypothetical protein JCM10450v2_007221 [Rhodotorula kratochvilovae]
MNSLVPGMKARSDSHNSAFRPSKTDAVLYLPPNQRRPDHLPRVLPRGVPVAYAPSLTMLGTEIDEKLAFSPHIARTAERAAVALRGVGLRARRGAGLAPRWARQVVVACVLPRLAWASAAWFDPASGTDQVSPLVTRTTAGEALAVEAGLQPVRLRLQKSLFRLARCAIAALPSHPLHRRTLLPDPIAPWALEPAINACIDQTKEKACEMHLAKISSLPSESILVYSDGLLLDGRAGAGVVSRVVLEDDEDGEGLL